MKEPKNNQLASRRKYGLDFKTEALRMIANDRSVYQVAQTLGVCENLLYRWRSQQQSADGLTKEKKIAHWLLIMNDCGIKCGNSKKSGRFKKS